MPYPSQINPEAVITQALDMIEAEGVEALSLARLAAALNVKAPSLYRHFASKAALLQAVNLHTATALTQAMEAALAAAPAAPPERVVAMAQAYRAFAHAHPRAYALLYSSQPPEQRPDPALLEPLALPLQAVIAELTGEAASLAALRGLWALVHGFILLELNGQFQRGGDLGAAFTRVVQAYIAGLAAVNPL